MSWGVLGLMFYTTSCGFAKNEYNVCSIIRTWCYLSHVLRSRLRRRLQNTDNDEEDKEENKDIKEVIIGKDNGADYKFAEVVGG